MSRCVHVCISTPDRWPQNSSKISADRNVQHLHSFSFLFPLSCLPLFHLLSAHLLLSSSLFYFILFNFLPSHTFNVPFIFLFFPPLLFLSSLTFSPFPPSPLISHFPFLFPPAMFSPLIYLSLLLYPLYFLPFPSLLSSPAAISSPFLYHPFTTSLFSASLLSFSSSLFCLFPLVSYPLLLPLQNDVILFFTHPLVFIFALFFHSFLLLSLHPLCVWIIVCSRSPFASCALKLITFFSNLIFTFYPFLLIRPINCNCLMLLLPILSIVSSPLLSSPLLSSPLLSSPLLPSPLSGAVCCLTWITTFTSSEAPRCLAISKMQVAQVRQGPVLHRSLLGPSLHTQQILHL